MQKKLADDINIELGLGWALGSELGLLMGLASK